MNKWKVLGAMAGLAIGAVASILLASKKGSKTRKLIIDKGDDYVKEAKSKFDEFRDTISSKLNNKELNKGTEPIRRTMREAIRYRFR